PLAPWRRCCYNCIRPFSLIKSTCGVRSLMSAALEGIASSVSDQSSVFGVVPTLFVLSPLALLVPALLGGLALCLRRWLALLSAPSLGSTLYVLHGLFRGYIKDYWWGSPRALFGALAVVALAGVVWSWRRHQGARPAIKAALTSEGIVLWALAFTCGGL